MQGRARLDRSVQGRADHGDARAVGADDGLEPFALATHPLGEHVPEGGHLRLVHPRLGHREHRAQCQRRDIGGVRQKLHLRIGLEVLDLLEGALHVHDVLRPDEAFEMGDHAFGNDLARRQQSDAARLFSGDFVQDVLEGEAFDRVLLVGELERFRRIDGHARARGKLAGDVDALEAGDDAGAERVGAEAEGDLFNGVIGVPAEIGDLAAVVLVGEGEGHVNGGLGLDGSPDRPATGDELLARDAVAPLDRGRIFHDDFQLAELLGEGLSHANLQGKHSGGFPRLYNPAHAKCQEFPPRAGPVAVVSASW